jgi:hypothetical protein
MSTIDELNKVKQELETRLESERQAASNEEQRKNQAKNQAREDKERDQTLEARKERMMGTYNVLQPLMGGGEISADDVLMLLCAVIGTLPESYAGGFVSNPERSMRDFAESLGRMRAAKVKEQPHG